MAGFPLRWGAVACASAVACGPVVGNSTDAGGEGGSSGLSLDGSGEASTSPPTTATTSTATSGSDPSVGTSVGEASSTSGASSSEGGGEPYCDPEQAVCGEFSICYCGCDTDPECCYCDAAVCTEDAHCGEGSSCLFGWHNTTQCVPAPDCHLLRYATIESQADLDEWAGDTCLGSLDADDASLIELAPLASLVYVAGPLHIASDETLASLVGLESLREVGVLELADNAALTDVSALAGLERIVEGGVVSGNPLLPAAAVHELLAGIDGGDAVTVCGNLDDVPCR